MDDLTLIGRAEPLFAEDMSHQMATLTQSLTSARCLVIGGAGSIGQAVVRALFKHDLAALHVVDISENNMVELVRDIRSTLGYGRGEFKTFAIDVGDCTFDALIASQAPYDYIFNLSALKHVRSEKDPFSLMRMIEVNILNTLKTIAIAHKQGATRYFCVSTDKAARPVNMMGASKCIMEQFLMRESERQSLSMARFANVAFSDGSLLHSFQQRFQKAQPLSAPHDVRRYFITAHESGELCLLSALCGENRDIFVPQLDGALPLISFPDIARRFLRARGYEAYECASEDEARHRASELIAKKSWPCVFFPSDTTGEKDVEVFYTENEDVDMTRFARIGVIRNQPIYDEARLDYFLREIDSMRANLNWTKQDMVDLFLTLLPDFAHKETGRYLDDKM